MHRFPVSRWTAIAKVKIGKTADTGQWHAFAAVQWHSPSPTEPGIALRWVVVAKGPMPVTIAVGLGSILSKRECHRLSGTPDRGGAGTGSSCLIGFKERGQALRSSKCSVVVCP